MAPFPFSLLVGLSIVAGLPAPGQVPDQTRSGRIDLVMGMGHDYTPVHYAILTNEADNEEVLVSYHDAINAGFSTGDIVELDLREDQKTSEQPEIPHGHPGVNLKRIARVRSHQQKASAKAASTGRRSILAIRMNYQDKPENQCDETCVMTNMYNSAQSVQAMYLENSYGALTFDTSSSATKPRVITVSIARSIGDPCGSVQSSLGQISAEADAAVQAAGISLSQYDVKVYFTPAICGIGVSYIGEIRSYINSGSSDTIAHELGHTFGVGHASLDSANYPANFQVTFGQSQSVILEYGDVAGVMGIGGYGMRGMVGPHRNVLGWIPSVATLAPTLTACPTTVTLRTLFQTPDSTGVSLVRIPKASGGNYFLSFRTPQGQDSNMRYANMVGIHSHAGGSANTFLWKYLSAGQTSTTSDGLVVSVVSVQGTTAVITIANSAAGSCTSPSVAPSASQTPVVVASASQTPTHSVVPASASQTPTHSVVVASVSQTPTHSPAAQSASQTPTHSPAAQSASQTPTHSPVAASHTPSPTSTPKQATRATLHCGQSIQGSNVGTLNQFTVMAGDGSDVAYDFALTASTAVTFSVCNQANFDTILGLFSGTTRLVVVDDTQGCNLTSAMTVNLSAGNYIVVVDGYGGATGSYTITAACKPL